MSITIVVGDTWRTPNGDSRVVLQIFPAGIAQPETVKVRNHLGREFCVMTMSFRQWVRGQKAERIAA